MSLVNKRLLPYMVLLSLLVLKSYSCFFVRIFLYSSLCHNFLNTPNVLLHGKPGGKGTSGLPGLALSCVNALLCRSPQIFYNCVHGSCISKNIVIHWRECENRALYPVLRPKGPLWVCTGNYLYLQRRGRCFFLFKDLLTFIGRAADL